MSVGQLVSAMSVQFAPVCQLDFATWEAMWLQYSGPQQPDADLAASELTYSRLVDPNFSLHGVVALDKLPVGFAHFYFHPSSWSVSENCCLQDLFVSPAARGRGVGRALVEAVAHLARQRGCSVLHWRTRESNAPAHALYSQFAQRTEFVSYRLPL